MKKILVIMGSHPNGSQYFDWTRKDCEIWLFNEAPSDPKYKRCDVSFQLHHEAIWKSPKNRSDEKHYEWLKSGKTPLIYMQDKFKDVPRSVKYPLKDVLNLTKNIKLASGKDFKCFTSTPDIALALVAQMWKKGKKYKKVEVWGVELETQTEYNNQRMGFGYWLGYLTALGVNLEIHNNMFTSPLYGYEGDIAISSKIISDRIDGLKLTLKDNYQKEAKEFLALIPGLGQKDISDVIQRELNLFTARNEESMFVLGQIKESQRYLEKAMAMEKETKESVFSMGEFDGSKREYGNQYIKVRSQADTINTKLDLIMKYLLSQRIKSKNRNKAVVEFGVKVAELMNKNLLLTHIVGAIRENEHYLSTSKLSIERSINGN
jgi:hypothetical protein